MMLPLAFLLSTALTAALLAFFAFWQRYLQKAKIASSTDSSFAPYTSATYPILGSLQYFSAHREFLRTATKDGAASFHLARQQCIAVPVEKRQDFFSDSRLSFALIRGHVGRHAEHEQGFLELYGFRHHLGWALDQVLGRSAAK
jgi:hypothetical protein